VSALFELNAVFETKTDVIEGGVHTRYLAVRVRAPENGDLENVFQPLLYDLIET